LGLEFFDEGEKRRWLLRMLLMDRDMDSFIMGLNSIPVTPFPFSESITSRTSDTTTRL